MRTHPNMNIHQRDSVWTRHLAGPNLRDLCLFEGVEGEKDHLGDQGDTSPPSVVDYMSFTMILDTMVR